MLTRIFSVLWIAVYAAALPQLTGADAVCKAAGCTGVPHCYPVVQIQCSCCPCSTGSRVGYMQTVHLSGQCPCMAAKHRPERSLLLLADSNVELGLSSVMVPAALVSLPVTSLTAARSVAIDHARQPQPVLSQK